MHIEVNHLDEDCYALPGGRRLARSLRSAVCFAYLKAEQQKGWLRNSFRPSQEIRMMRTYWRQRNDLVQSASRHIQRMQKRLTQMNVQLANVLSDVSGVTGQAIIKAILAGERNPHKLAAFRDPRVKASEKQISRLRDSLFAKIWRASANFCSQRRSNPALSSGIGVKAGDSPFGTPSQNR